MDSSQWRDGRSESGFHGIPIYASSKDSWKLNLQQKSTPRRDGLGQMALLTRNMVLQRIPRNWLHNDDAVRILPGIIWNQCHFYRKSNFNGLLRIFVFMKFPKTVSKQECCQNSPQGRDGRGQSECENPLELLLQETFPPKFSLSHLPICCLTVMDVEV